MKQMKRFERMIEPSAGLMLCWCMGCAGEAAWDSPTEARAPDVLPTPYTYAEDNVPPSSAGARSGAEVGTLAQPLTSDVYGTVTYIGDIPSNKDTDGWFNHAQGVALAPQSGVINMFYSENGNIRGREAQSSSQFGISQSFPSGTWHIQLDSLPAGIPDSYDHFGDLDYVENAVGTTDLLYVPLEQSSQVNAPYVVVYSVTPPNGWVMQGTALLAENPSEQAPWISAWTPNPRYLVTSAFTASATQMYYDATEGVGVSFNAAAETVELTTAGFASLTLQRIQGGEFNKDGRLFLIAEDGPSDAGVYAFAFATATSGSFSGQLVLRQFDFYPATITAGRNEEFEGLTVGTIDPPGANDLSRIHVVLSQDGSIFFKHWNVSQNTGHFAP